MRFSELNGKEVIDLNNGERIGVVGHTDLVINPETGEIKAMILPSGSFFGIKKQKEEIYISWHAIKKIGPEMIIVEQKDRVNPY